MDNPLIVLDLDVPDSLVPSESGNPLEDYEVNLKDQILTFYEARFWLDNKLPSVEEVKNRFNLSKNEVEIYYDLIAEPLKNRLGILLPSLKPLTPVKDRGPDFELDPVFVVAVSIICDTADKRTTAAKLKALGMTTKQWQAQLTLPAHEKYFQERLNSAFGSVDTSAKLSLAKNVEAGDLQSIKYYHEFTGKYRPNNDNLTNIAFLLGRLMEVISKYVTPEVMAQLADEIDTVLDVKEIESGN